MHKTCRRVTTCGLLIVGLTGTPPLGAAPKGTPVTPKTSRVAELATRLPEAPVGLGRPITDRDAWRPMTKASGAARAIEVAEELVDTPIPELTDDLFLDFSRTGNRSRCQRVLSLRHARISRFTLAECLENRGRFLPALKQSIRAVCSEKTWVMPAHDRSLKNFRGELIDIDLAVAGLSWELATSYYWLGDKLSPEIRQLIRDELRRRTFDPFKKCVNTGVPRMWWVTCTNNWNAVCLAGTVGAALAVVESPEERAFFVATAEKSIPFFLSGFTADGYCSEGTGYWNYGFPNAAREQSPAEPTPLALRDYFTEAGILICRPSSESEAKLGVALKGGHNAEHHNHNDVGSYLLVSNGGAPLLDPGSEVYTARTFSSKRYDSGVLNSFGHPVPRVAGKLQRTGSKAAATVVRTQFTNASDTIVLDLRAAYDVKELKRLLRTFVYSREKAGSLTVSDEVQFSEPRTFETALVTFSKWRQAGPNRLVVGEGKQAVEVTIDAGGFDVKVEPVRIEEDLKGGKIPTRLGLELANPTAHATITLTMRPAKAR